MISTTSTKKKLIEVAIPLETINAASAREKSIRHGHPSTLHLWWARRPLAACRAVLFAQLVDDPSSDLETFPTHEAQETERKRLFGIIEELVQWENSTNEEVLERARLEIRKSCGGDLPPVYDPFSGGGSIPLEAQRLGLPTYGSDLNPVAVMIAKAMIEIPPRFKDMPPIHPGPKERQFYRNAEGLAEDVKYYGEWMRKKAWSRIGHLYPQVDLSTKYGGGKATVMAWIWARTVESPNPAMQGRHVPIVKSFRLGGKSGQVTWITPVVDSTRMTYSFKIEARDTPPAIDSTSGRTNASCLVTGDAIPIEYIQEQGKRARLGRTLIAIVAEGKSGKIYLPPDVYQDDVEASVEYEYDLGAIEHWRSCTNCVVYGLKRFGDLHTKRELLALRTFSELLDEAEAEVLQRLEATAHNDLLKRGYADAIRIYLGLGVSKAADKWNSMTSWDSSRESVSHLFTRQAIPMVWDYAETNPFSSSAGNWTSYIEWIGKVIEQLVAPSPGIIFQRDAAAAEGSLPSCVISTDPPYYDNVPYSNLSDFFYPWIRDAGRKMFPELFSTLQVPKKEELVANQFRFGGKDAASEHFINGMKEALRRMLEVARTDYPVTIYYAFKQSEIKQDGEFSRGWADFLNAVIDAGFEIRGTWPVRTELSNRMMGIGNNALANSVVLVCRKKEEAAETITRAEFVRALRRELPQALTELQASNIAPADMPQSAIGPGMGVFSRYKVVLEAGDRAMTVQTALQLINRELDEHLGGIQGEFDADTRFAITWFEQNGLKTGDYGTANNIATARGISVESAKHAGIVESAAGKVRILSRDELDDDWDPADDRHLTVWECLQHLVRQHEKDGISHGTAVLLKKIEAKAEAAKDLAYCLYDISANKRKDAKEATAYNALIADWAELTRQAAAIQDTRGDRQTRLNF
jgi:putative DNA methylase